MGVALRRALWQLTLGGQSRLGQPALHTCRRTRCASPRRSPSIEVVATSPTSISTTVYPPVPAAGPFSVTATPVGGGATVTKTCASPACPLEGLVPGKTYSITATATAASGLATPPSPALSVATPPAGAPAVSASPTGPSTATATVSPPPGGAVTGPYTVTATPTGGGPAVVRHCPSTECSLAGLGPGTTYAVTATGVSAAGTPTAASAADTLTTPLPGCVCAGVGPGRMRCLVSTIVGPVCLPACRAPALTAIPVSSTSGEVTIYPAPSTTGPYSLTLTPVGGGSPITVACLAPVCPVRGLSPATTYGAAVVATDASGNPTPSSRSEALTTPGAGAPTLVSSATGSTTLSVSIAPPPGVTGPYSVTATPQSGGPAIAKVCPAPDCSLSGLAPGTLYAVTATGTAAGGKPTPPSAPESVKTATPVPGWVALHSLAEREACGVPV